MGRPQTNQAMRDLPGKALGAAAAYVLEMDHLFLRPISCRPPITKELCYYSGQVLHKWEQE